VHYLTAEDAVAQDALLCVQTRKLISDTKRMSMLSTPDLYLRSTKEMETLFHEYPEALKNTLVIADQCNVEIPTGKLNFPKFPLPEGETDQSYFAKLAREGMRKKFDTITPEMEERLEY